MKGSNLTTRLFLPAFILVATTIALQAQCLSGDCNNGVGTYRYPDQSKYTGEFRAGQRHGQGKMIYADGNVYDGPFFFNKKQGSNGTMIFASNGDRYVGEWKRDQPNGRGVYYFASRERYEGDFVNGTFEGEGTMYYPDGATYAGGWSKNRKNGSGMLRYSDGREKPGTWAMGKEVKRNPGAPNRNSSTAQTSTSSSRPSRTNTNTSKPDPTKPDVNGLKNCGTVYCRSGKGYYDYPEGSRWVGEFKDGHPFGKGICYYSNGDRYEGEWANNTPNGEGVMHFASGRVYGAIWMNGSMVQELDAQEAIPSDPVRMDRNAGVKIWAVVVGVGKYTAMPSLRFTDDDAFRFYSHLKSPEGGALPDSQIEILVDESATRENILRTMRKYFLRADENDVVMLYFSGHGLEGCFLPVDYDGYNNKLRHEEIRQIFKESKAKHKICIADACHSGTLDYSGALTAKGPAPVSLDHYYQAFEDSDGGIALLMSSKAEELSLEDHGLRQGVFTYYILRGMKGAADTNGDYIVTVRELYSYVYAKVREYTAGVQTPVLTGNYDENMPVSLRRY
ncbi:MAG: caspase family protein [Saprospiraceae bacterium]|nr:caspase family protein [Saprospiraceae bacterium]